MVFLTKYLFFLALLFASCNPSKNGNPFDSSQVRNDSSVVNTGEVGNYERAPMSAKLHLKNGFADEIKIVEGQNIVGKDSTTYLSYKIQFFKNGNLVKVLDDKLLAGGEQGDWSFDNEFMKAELSEVFDSRFVFLDYGVPACGYAHTGILYFIGEGTVSKVGQWMSVGDGPYGTYTNFVPKMAGDRAVSFTTVLVNIDSAEPEISDENGSRELAETVLDSTAEENEMFQITYSDSAKYSLQSGQWKRKAITPKDKIFRKELKRFKELYDQQ